MIKAIVFDKDGCLFDFNATWGAWSREMISSEVGGDPARMAQLADVLGYDLGAGVFLQSSIVIAETIEVVADAMLNILPETDKTSLIERMKNATQHVPQIEPVPLDATLSELKNMGLRLGVATNDAEAPARSNLAHVQQHFDFIAGFDSGFGGKPAPGQLLAFCDQSGVPPSNCIMVGDSTHDMQAGRAAGMRCVGVLTGPAPRHELAPYADVVMENIGGLRKWITEQNGKS